MRTTNRPTTDTSEYTWALAEQRRRADDDRGAVLHDMLDGLGRRLRCSIRGLLHGGGASHH